MLYTYYEIYYAPYVAHYTDPPQKDKCNLIVLHKKPIHAKNFCPTLSSATIHNLDTFSWKITTLELLVHDNS